MLSHRDSTYRIRDLVPTRGEVIGVRVPEIRKLATRFRRAKPELTLETGARLLDRAAEDRSREEILFAVFVLATYRRELSRALWERVDRWIEALDNWETCDQLATNVAGEIVSRDLSLVEDLVAWTSSPNRWRRRFAVATTTVLNQRGRRHPAETFRVCRPLVEDADPLVQKAVAWAIREASKHDEEAAFDFLTRHPSARTRIVREASAKLSPAHRAALAGR